MKILVVFASKIVIEKSAKDLYSNCENYPEWTNIWKISYLAKIVSMSSDFQYMSLWSCLWGRTRLKI